MTKIYYCPNCRIAQVSQPGMLCENCSLILGGPGGSPFGGSIFPSNAASGQDSTSPFDQNVFPASSPGAYPFPSDYGNSVPTKKNADNDALDKGFWNVPHGGLSSDDHRAQLHVAKDVFRGEIHNINVTPPMKRPSFLNRWFTSFFSGVPFTMKPMQVNIQLSIDGQQAAQMSYIGTAKSVQMYADDASYTSILAPGNRVVVNGSPDHHGVIQARTIYNETTATQLTCGTSPWIVRLITVALIGLLYVLIAQAGGMSSSLLNALQFNTERLGTMIGLLLVALVVLFSAKRNRRLRSILLWGIAIVLTALLVPQLCVIVIMLLGLKFLITGGF